MIKNLENSIYCLCLNISSDAFTIQLDVGRALAYRPKQKDRRNPSPMQGWQPKGKIELKQDG